VLDSDKPGLSYGEQHEVHALLESDEGRHLPQTLFLAWQRPIVAGKLTYYTDPESRSCSMLHDHLKSPVLAAALLLAVAGCATNEGVPALASGVCDPQAAQSLVGQHKPIDADAMRLTGATIVRQVGPADPVHDDLRHYRNTIRTDPGTGRVSSAICG
jgi:hypothetical protein